MKFLATNLLYAIVFISTMFSQTKIVSLRYENFKTKRFKINRNTNLDTLLMKQIESFRKQGYVFASIDSISLQNDTAFVLVYLGNKYKFGKITEIGTKVINRQLYNKLADFSNLNREFNAYINELNNKGYPFAKIEILKTDIRDDFVDVDYSVDTGLLVVWDSIVFDKKLKLSYKFVQNYLNCKKNRPFSLVSYKNIDKKMSYLSSFQINKPAEIEFRSNKTDVYLYLLSKQVNSLSGVIGMQLKSKKIDLVGQVDLVLHNSLKISDEIVFNWQKISANSQKVNLYFDFPYIFSTKLGIANNFVFLQQDTNLFCVTNDFYASYFANAFNRLSFYYNLTQTISLDTVSWGEGMRVDFWGISFYNRTTNDFYFPRMGHILKFEIAVAPQKKDFGFRTMLIWEYYRSVWHGYTIKLANRTSFYKFQNNLFGNFLTLQTTNLLRGFEIDYFRSHTYTVFTGELRYFFANYTFLGGFVDLGIIKNAENKILNAYSLGTVFNFLVKKTFLNLSLAVGSVYPQKIDFKQFKLHFKVMNLI